MLRGFSRKGALRHPSPLRGKFPRPLDLLLKIDSRICLEIVLRLRTDIQSPASHTTLRHPIALKRSHGILTMSPSAAAFAITLGPTNPWLIIIAKETLVFRRPGFSPKLRLLVPTFSLPNAPPCLAALASLRIGTLSYHSPRPKARQVLSFGTMLNPDYLRRKIS